MWTTIRKKLKALTFIWLNRILIGFFSDPAQSSEVTRLLQFRNATTPLVFGGGSDKVSLGSNVKIVNALLNVSSGHIFIGDDTFFGHNVSLITGTHHVHQTGAERQEYPFEGRDIFIGKGVWIASNAVVLGPCRINDHVVIGAGSVVLGGELAEGWLYAGVPAKRIKRVV